MKPRPQTKVVYDLTIIVEDGGEIKKSFTVSYDSEIYDDDKESTDLIFIKMRMADLKEIYGNNILLLTFDISREEHKLH
ncbi:hypothetical protein [Bacillus subtilis]|uniref:hypothetical protein n=1 Tax=Bacillus subtilis TaxID=1423 RepID=UPI002DBAA340|nr:hypothetical protein [Bacillus subtilis]MEC2335083.1 hypothetical protein [Bacillus subtilis]